MAVAAFVDRIGPQPEILSLAIKCENWNSLPKSGGVLDQPDWLLTKMSIALNSYRAYTSYKKREAGTEIEWKKRNQVYWDILKEYGLLYG